MLVVAISGSTCAGKGTVAARLLDLLKQEGINVALINQDDYFFPLEKLKPMPQYDNYEFDTIDAIDFQSINNEVAALTASHIDEKPAVCIVEGHMILGNQDLVTRSTLKFFLTLDFTECKRRRRLRTDYIPPDTQGFFDNYVWPAYENHLSDIKLLHDVQFVDGTTPVEESAKSIFVCVLQTLSPDWLSLSETPISTQLADAFVRDDSCGALSIFIGTTRNSFNGHHVVSLEYQAYESMAIAQMKQMCLKLRKMFPSLCRIALLHRLGTVPVKESSVIIAVSSAHRKEAQEATQFAINELKKTVPIWKKEIYSDGSSNWKENAEWVH